MKKGDRQLLISAVVKYTSGVLLTAALLFIPAGTLRYSGAWLFMGLLFLPMLVAGCLLWRYRPELLRKRLEGQEQEAVQKAVAAVFCAVILGSLILSGLDRRFGWTSMPAWLRIAGTCLFLAGYGLYGETARENAYLSRKVEIQEEQKVIDTGLYGIVRHPMYLGAVLLFCSAPLVLGSYPAFFLMLLFPAVIVVRILNEEKVLADGLPGYREYQKKVRFRLLPMIW